MKHVLSILLMGSICVFAQNIILPSPARVVEKAGNYKISSEATIAFDGTLSPQWNIAFQPLAEDLGEEGYRLHVTPNGVVIQANTEAGRYYGLISLKQWSATISDGEIPCVLIEDRPKYPWRSFMLDSGRQYQRIETIKGVLDRMALLKMNVFHWHLTENAGWRVEIQRYPKLTKVGAFVSTGKEQQGFYSQQDIAEIVRYAAKRHIRVVPEIDLPGHANAALLAYPELTCFGKAPQKTKGHSPYLFCGGNDEVYPFLYDVLDEVCAMFPSQFIHIGGDEAPKDHWNHCDACQGRIRTRGLKNSHGLQIDFTNHLARHLKKRGRKAICWGDVLTQPGPKLEDNIVVQWWNWRGHKDKALRMAIQQEMQAIANTNYYTYLNFPHSPWKGYTANRTFNLRTCYESNPSDLLNPSPNEKKALLGMGASLWTDYNLTEDLLDARMFPRIIALAEQMWSTTDRLPYEQFEKKVQAMRNFLTNLKIGGTWDTP